MLHIDTTKTNVKKCKDKFKDACIWGKMELITPKLSTSTRRMRLKEGQKGHNYISILFLKLIIGYMEVYYILIYIFHYYETFPNNFKKSGFLTFGI